MQEFLVMIVGAFVRAALQFASGAGIVVAQDMEGKATSVLIFVATAAWSVWQKYKSQKK